MRDLLSRDLTWLRRGATVYSNPRQMVRSIRTAALREGPKHWVWKYAWGLVEETITELWAGQGGGSPPAPAGSRETSSKEHTERDCREFRYIRGDFRCIVCHRKERYVRLVR